MHFRFLATVIVLLVGSQSLFAAPIVTFDFEFRDGGGTPIGTGFYQFEDIAPGVKASFASLNSFVWEFNVPSLGLFLSSANGDIPSSDSLVNEGILLSGSPGSRTLTFFDDVATFVLHRDVSNPFPIGIEFRDDIPDWVQYIPPSGPQSVGAFTAVESAAVPEPASIAVWSLLLLTGAGLIYFRRIQPRPVLA